MAPRANGFQSVHSEGGLLPIDLLRRILDPKEKLPGTKPEDYGLPQGERPNEVITQSWNRLRKHWAEFRDALSKSPTGEAGTGVTNDKWSLPLLRELGFGLLPTTAGPEINGRTYAINRFFGPVPVHLIGYGLSLDRRAAGVRGAAAANPHGLVQEFVNRSPGHLWAIASNGLRFRVLRDNQALSRQSYLEFDLEAMFAGEVYSDFVLLWLMAHATRFAPREGDRPDTCWLEQWTKLANEQGTRALGELRDGVEMALRVLGEGFTSHPKNTALRDALRSGQVPLADFHGQLLRVVYRLIFLFVTEDRTIDGQSLLHARDDSEAARLARQRFADYYSTSRLREMASKIKGSRHGDLWRQFQFLVGPLSGSQDHAKAREYLALPPLGSFLWDPASTAALNDAELTNHDFLEALRHLAFTRQGKVLRPVDYQNLGAEELGGVYESLLALTPQISADGARFTFAEFAGNERKTSGSYYTPDSLVQCLLDSALDPVVEEALKGKKGAEAEKAILSLKVCDPAVGSGHFLVGAAHRLARHLARVRALAQGESEPSPLLYQHALRDVIGRCLYGVDINPMAAELCRVSLWLEALDPGKPLSFLDHRIRVGNSLLGVTPALLAKGIPDEAFEPIEGDDKAVCRELKKRNKDERKGQGQLWDAAGRPWERLGNVATALMSLDAIDDNTIHGVEQKEKLWEALVRSGSYLSGRLLADAWCAAFVWKKTREMGDAITESVFRRIERNPHDLTPWMRDEIKRLAEQYQFFHWHLAFPDVFRVPGPDDEPKNEQAGWSGGFDVVLGNPPWERIKLAEDEWFATIRPDIANAANATARASLIAKLAQEAPQLHAQYLTAKRRADGASSFLRSSGTYPFCGCGDINTYSVFAELNRRIMSHVGRVGCVLQAGIATDKTTSAFFQDIVNKNALVCLYSFDNHEAIFPGIKSSTRFCLLTLAGASRPFAEAIRFAFYARTLDDIRDPDRCVVLSAQDIALLNPNTNTCPVFQSARDFSLVSSIYRNLPVVVNESNGTNPWDLSIRRILDMNKEDVLALCVVSPRETLEPCVGVYEAKLFDQMNHRGATYEGARVRGVSETELVDPLYTPWHRYWLASTEVAGRLPEYWRSRWLLVWQDVTDVNTMARTVSAAVLPLAGTDFTVRVGFPRTRATDAALCFVGTLNSFVFDYVSRQKIGGTHLSDYILKQLPILTPDCLLDATKWGEPSLALRAWLLPRVLELAYTAWALEPFAQDCGWYGPPLQWDEERRSLIRCELDAAFFHLYLGAPQVWRRTGSPERLRHFSTLRDAVEYILETFPIVKRKDEAKYGSYRTKETILANYDEMAQAIAANEASVAAGKQPTAAYKTRLNPPPGPPSDAAGNFLPLPEWKPGQPRPADWPPHIHAPREVHEWAIAAGIDWRELLDGPPGVLPKPKREPQPVPAIRVPTAASGADRDGVLPGFERAVAAIESESKRRERDKELVLQAFRDVRNGYSPDYVIAAPDLNPQFLARARELGVECPDVEINLMLYGARKASKLKDDPTTREYRLPKLVLPFVFASEWAVRHLQRDRLAEANREPSLDDILCDPELVRRFDAIVARIKPGFSQLEYRWAALGLRKTGRKTADELSIGFPLNQQLTLFDLDPADVPETAGLYLIQAEDKPLYVNATDNLRAQVARHRECAGNVLVPEWLAAARGTPTRLSFAALYGADVKRLKEARIRQVATLQPWLNLLDLPGAA